MTGAAVKIAIRCRHAVGDERFGSEEFVPVTIEAAVDALADRHPDTVMVAAAGNDGTTVPAWPAAHKSVVAVGASGKRGFAPYSNRGTWVNFCVPADGVVSTYVRGIRRAECL